MEIDRLRAKDAKKSCFKLVRMNPPFYVFASGRMARCSRGSDGKQITDQTAGGDVFGETRWWTEARAIALYSASIYR